MPLTNSIHKRALKKSVEKLQFYVNKQIAAAFKKREADLEARAQGSDSKELFIFIDQLVYETQDRDFIRDQLLNIFFPARDASSAGASFIFFILARHPDVWAKLRSEILSFKHPLSSRNLNSMPYLHNVINECEYCECFPI
jgi:cytochrome P450